MPAVRLSTALPRAIIALLGLLLLLGPRPASGQETSDSSSPAAVGERLVRAYPNFLTGVDGANLVWADGTRMPLSDGNREKSFDERLAHPDLVDMFAQVYRLGRPGANPPPNEDPGRFRNEAFFTKMYGDCSKGEVTPRMRRVRWMPDRGGGTVMVTTVNGVADRLEAVIRDLQRLPASMTGFLVPSSGTYLCRAIAGTDQRSMHAYAAAIDLNASRADYWRWPQVPSGPIPYRNHVPFEIAELFEQHGFIWGGKWYHFDTMHFEYRPELFPVP